MDTIWWTKVTNASLFLDKIVTGIQEGQNIVLQLPKKVPWYEKMREIIETELRKQNSNSSFRCLEDISLEPGQYLMNEFCKKEKRAQYRPGIGYAKFLAESEDIVLNEYILWIIIENQERAKIWCSFVEEYKKSLKGKQGCRFLIETRDDFHLQPKKGMKQICYEKEIEDYDKYLFHMLVAANMKESVLFKKYLAEAVSSIVINDVELSGLCVLEGRNFLESPTQMIKNIIEAESRSDGTRFSIEAKEADIEERLWEAQIKSIFPLIEKHRNVIVKKYYREIELLLPIKAVYGEEFKEVNDVEIGTISYLANLGKIQMSKDDFNKVEKLKKARNTLAHIGILSQKEVEQLLNL